MTAKERGNFRKWQAQTCMRLSPRCHIAVPIWTGQIKKSRSSVEMNDSIFRPEIAGKLEGMDQYDLVFVGFPIWWYVAPTIINTFLESYDFSGKIIVPFATSGGSGMGNTNEKLAPSCPGAILMKGKMLNGLLSQEELKAWIKSL